MGRHQEVKNSPDDSEDYLVCPMAQALHRKTVFREVESKNAMLTFKETFQY